MGPHAIGVAALFVVGDHAIVPIVGALLAAFWVSGTTALICGIRCSRGPARPTVGRRFLVSFGLRGSCPASPQSTYFAGPGGAGAVPPPSALGLYVVGLAFTNLPYFIAKSVGLITFPWVASRREKADARRTMWSLLWLTTGIAVVIVAAMCATALWLVPFFFGGQFDAAVTVTYIVLPGTVFLSARRVLSEGLKGRGYPLAGTVGELVFARLDRGGAGPFRAPWGIYGAAVALTSSYVVSLLLLVVIAARHGSSSRPAGRSCAAHDLMEPCAGGRGPRR